MKNAIQEGYEIVDGEKVIAVSPIFTDNRVNKTEHCLPINPNLQYSLRLISKESLGWQPGSFVEVKDAFLTVLYKGYPLSKTVETVPLSFFKLLPMNDLWRVTTHPQGNWKDMNYDDSDWELVHLGGTDLKLTGNQFFRKVFAGSSGFAAYEARFNYNDGVVAYINSVEVFRDNMPDGPITPEMNATQFHREASFKGCIRNFYELGVGGNLLAVELHYKNVDVLRNVTFNAMVSAFPSNVKDAECFVVGTTPAVSEQGKSSHGIYAFNYNLGDFWNPKFKDGVMMLKFTYNYIRPAINTLEIYPDKYNHTAPVGFVFSGSIEDSLPKRTPVLFADNIEYIDYQNRYVSADMFVTPFQYYYFNITRGHESSIRLPEIHPAVCASHVKPTLFYPFHTWKVAEYSIVYPSPLGFRLCTIEPSLPDGFSIDYYTCAIEGVPKEAPFRKEYTVTAGHWSEYKTVFTLSVESCSTNPIEIERVYSMAADASSAPEGFRILDDKNNTLWSEDAPAKQGYQHSFCTDSTFLQITLTTTAKCWNQGSYLIIRSLLDHTNRTLARLRYDDYLHLPHTVTLPLYVVNDYDEWYYMMDSIPETWYDEDVEEWEVSRKNAFPEAPTQIQLFKRQFTVSHLEILSGLEISLKHRYGVVLYVNGIDIYRWGVSGPLTNETFSGHAYNNAKVQTLHLPAYIQTEEGYKPLLKEENWIAIGIVSVSLKVRTCYFSASIRPIFTTSSRLLDFTYFSMGLEKDAKNVFDDFGVTTISNSDSIHTNYIEINFGDNREWINGVAFTNKADGYALAPTQFIILGREDAYSDWEELKRIDSVDFWETGQEKVIFFENTKLYGQFRLTSLLENPSLHWYLSRVNLLSLAPINQETLRYPPIHGIAGYPMNRVLPLGSGFSSFSVEPAFHSLTMDSVTGSIVGIPSLEESRLFTITAVSLNGEMQAVEVPVEITPCPTTSVPVTITLVVDSFPSTLGYILYGPGNTTITIEDPLQIPNTNYTRSFCLSGDDYRVDFISHNPKGWLPTTGYFITVKNLIVASGSVGKAVHTPSIHTVQFTTLQVLTPQTFYRTSTVYEENWMAKDFDDSQWVLQTDTQFPEDVNAFFIRTTLPAIQSNRTSLTIQLEANTEFDTVVYHNGNYIGMNLQVFSLYDSLDREGVIAIAFLSNASYPFSCRIHAQYAYTSILPNTFWNCTSTPLKRGVVENLFDHNPTTSIVPQLNTEKQVVFEWYSSSPHGSIFNAYSFTARDTTAFTVTLYGKTSEQEDSWTLLDHHVGVRLYDRQTVVLHNSFGLAHFKHFYMMLVMLTEVPPTLISLDFHYVRPLSDFCPTEGAYLAVLNQEWSYAECDELHVGYQMRKCMNGQFGPVDDSHCLPKHPSYLRYEKSHFTFYENQEILLKPEYDGILEFFEMEPSFDQLTISEEGLIEGRLNVTAPTLVTVVGMSGNFTIETGFVMQALPGECVYHDRTLKVGETGESACSYEGSFLKGTVKLMCVVKNETVILEKDVHCSFNAGPFVGIILFVVVILVVLWLVLRKRKRGEEVNHLVYRCLLRNRTTRY